MTIRKVSPDRAMYGIRDIAVSLSVSVPTAYNLIGKYKLGSLKVSRRRLYPAEEVARLVESMKRDGGYKPHADTAASITNAA